MHERRTARIRVFHRNMGLNEFRETERRPRWCRMRRRCPALSDAIDEVTRRAHSCMLSFGLLARRPSVHQAARLATRTNCSCSIMYTILHRSTQYRPLASRRVLPARRQPRRLRQHAVRPSTSARASHDAVELRRGARQPRATSLRSEDALRKCRRPSGAARRARCGSGYSATVPPLASTSSRTRRTDSSVRLVMSKRDSLMADQPPGGSIASSGRARRRLFPR